MKNYGEFLLVSQGQSSHDLSSLFVYQKRQPDFIKSFVTVRGCRFTVHGFFQKPCNDWRCSSFFGLFNREPVTVNRERLQNKDERPTSNLVKNYGEFSLVSQGESVYNTCDIRPNTPPFPPFITLEKVLFSFHLFYTNS